MGRACLLPEGLPERETPHTRLDEMPVSQIPLFVQLSKSISSYLKRISWTGTSRNFSVINRPTIESYRPIKCGARDSRLAF